MSDKVCPFFTLTIAFLRNSAIGALTMMGEDVSGAYCTNNCALRVGDACGLIVEKYDAFRNGMKTAGGLNKTGME